MLIAVHRLHQLLVLKAVLLALVQLVEVTRLRQVSLPLSLDLKLLDELLNNCFFFQLVSLEQAGFMPLRGEFEVEYENEAEALISPLTFDPDDTPDETELKYQVLELYRYLFRKKRRQKERTKLK